MPEYVVGRVEEAAGPKLRWCQYEVQHVELQRGWWGGRGPYCSGYSDYMQSPQPMNDAPITFEKAENDWLDIRSMSGLFLIIHGSESRWCGFKAQSRSGRKEIELEKLIVSRWGLGESLVAGWSPAFEALSSPSLAEVEGAMWSRTRSKSMFDGLGIAIKVELAVRVKRIGNFFSQPRRSLPPNAGRFFALASNVTPPLQLESLPPTSANSPPAQMDPPDRHGPPRKRDQVKGWLKKHLTGSTTPSPSLSPAPSQTNLSKDQTPRPFPGTAAKAGAGVNVSLMCESPSTGHNFYEGVKTTLRAIERAADVFTPLKSTAAALLVICDTIDAYGKNREEFERLLKRVDVISSIMASWPKDASQGAEDRFSGLSRTLVDMQKLLTNKIDEDRSKLERAMLTAQDGQELLKITREIELAMEIALFEATATNERRTLQIVDNIGWIKDRFC
ncbi:hypothetical protein DFP72DRAFT_1040221, partial [Ephemerocybe angulata]